jgi:hypothetical protein
MITGGREVPVCVEPNDESPRYRHPEIPASLDPQGKAIEGALRLAPGLAGVSSVRQGKVFDIEIEGDDRRSGRGTAQTGRLTELLPIP